MTRTTIRWWLAGPIGYPLATLAGGLVLGMTFLQFVETRWLVLVVMAFYGATVIASAIPRWFMAISTVTHGQSVLPVAPLRGLQKVLAPIDLVWLSRLLIRPFWGWITGASFLWNNEKLNRRGRALVACFLFVPPTWALRQLIVLDVAQGRLHGVFVTAWHQYYTVVPELLVLQVFGSFLVQCLPPKLRYIGSTGLGIAINTILAIVSLLHGM